MDTEKGIQILQHSQRLSEILLALTQLAMMRAATVDTPTLKLYSRKLEKERSDDLFAAIAKIGELPRSEGDAAFPSIGTILAMVGVMRVARQNRERAEREGYQQQVCPDCGGVVGMVRPRGEQFRTWCVPCQSYRKIVPEDMSLTDGEWRILCSELTVAYQDWKNRGSDPGERVDPQFNRENVRGAA